MIRIITILFALMISTAQAAIIYEEPFNYGNSTDDIENVSNWNTGSGVVNYDHDGGLDHPQMNNESSGSMFHDFGSGNRGGTNTDAASDPFPSASAGDEFWLVGLMQLNNLDGISSMGLDNQENVNRWGFGVDGSGNVVLYASDDGGAPPDFGNAPIDTGVDAAADGSTYLFLSRATLGSGTSPTDSTIDFWFNPADTSSVAALGSATFTTGADSKIGRDSGAYTEASIDLAFGNRADELRFGETLTDAIAVPEPSTYAAIFGALALAGVMLRRRLRR